MCEDIRVEYAVADTETLLGYKIFGELTTIGNYTNVTIKPSVYVYDTYTGETMMADVWVKTSHGYKLNILSGESAATMEYAISYGLGSFTDVKYDDIRDASLESGAMYITLSEEKYHRMVTDEDIAYTKILDDKFFSMYKPDNMMYPFDSNTVSELLQYIGSNGLIKLTTLNRVYVGSPHTNTEKFNIAYGEDGVKVNGMYTTNIENKVDEDEYAIRARRWLFTLGLDENSYLVPYSKTINGGVHMNPNGKLPGRANGEQGLDPIEDFLYSKEAIENDRYVILYCADTLVYSDKGPWTLEFEAFRQPQTVKINGVTVTFPESIPDIIAVMGLQMQEEDYDIIQSH